MERNLPHKGIGVETAAVVVLLVRFVPSHRGVGAPKKIVVLFLAVWLGERHVILQPQALPYFVLIMSWQMLALTQPRNVKILVPAAHAAPGGKV